MFFAGQNIVFIHVPKTGGNYFARMFLAQSSERLTTVGHQDGIDRFDLAGNATRSKHQDLREYHETLGDRLADCRVWATYRDPVERMVSLYFSPHRWMERRADGSYAPPPYDSVPFDLDQFRNLLHRARSTWQILDCDSMHRLPTPGIAGQHRTGAAVHLFRFSDLQAQLKTFAEREGFELTSVPERAINPSTVTKERSQGICDRQDVIDLVLASHHGQDVRLAEGARSDQTPTNPIGKDILDQSSVRGSACMAPPRDQ